VQENSTLVTSPPWPHAGDTSVADDQPQLHQWIARELHDLVVQPLISTLVELDAVERDDLDLAPERAQVLQRELRAALHGVRLLMNQLRGQTVDEGDLVPRVAVLVADVCARTGIDVTLRVAPGWPSDLAPETGRNLCRIIEEALRNVVRHSGASSVEVKLENLRGSLRVSVTDDGVFGPETSGGSADGMGTRGMHERAVVIGGVLTIDHARSGSTVAVVVGDPVAEQVGR